MIHPVSRFFHGIHFGIATATTGFAHVTGGNACGEVTEAAYMI